jgi:phage shock protein E
MNKKTILDVRTPMEFQGGNVAGSINIPLHEIPQRFNEIKKMAQPIILCCASGSRSGQATHYLQSNGIECENGGCWMDVNYNYKTA